MTFNDWCARYGGYLNDSDDAARAAKLMARRAWDAKPVQQGGWHDAAQWLRDNYQDHQTIAGLCDAMVAAAPVQPSAFDPVAAMRLADNYAFAQSELDGEHSTSRKYYVDSRDEARAALAAYLGIKGGGNG